jgi:hypothetical protein
MENLMGSRRSGRKWRGLFAGAGENDFGYSSENEDRCSPGRAKMRKAIRLFA